MWHPIVGQVKRQREEREFINMLACEEKARVLFINKFVHAAKEYKNESDKTILFDVLSEINKLEKQLIDNLSKSKSTDKNKTASTTNVFEEHEEKMKKFENAKLELTHDDHAAWRLYYEAVLMSVSLVGNNKIKNQLSDGIKDDLILMKRSVAFTTKVVGAESKLNVTDIEEGNNIVEGIRERQQAMLLGDEAKNIDIVKRRALYVAAFGAVLFVATIVVMAMVISAGSATPAVLIVLACAFSTFGIVGGGAAIGMGLGLGLGDDAKNELVKPQQEMHRFYQTAKQHGQKKKVIDPDATPKETKKKN